MYFNSDHEKSPNVVFSFNSNQNIEKYENVLFEISDIYVPLLIAQNQIPSETKAFPNPKKEIVERLLFFIFRKEKFREGQWESIERTLQGKDSILLMPTGGGKTIAFQLASLLRTGPCLVIDPLIALIDDQVENLKSYGIDRAIGISSQLSQENRLKSLSAFSNGHYLFCYVAPERLQMQDFRSALRGLTTISPISVIAIDEAHCVSEWGHDFRVSYLNIARNARNYCSKDNITPPLLGLTGTASRSVLMDVKRELDITDFDAVITPLSFDRSELKFSILHCRSNEKDDRMKGFISSLPGKFGISNNTFFLSQGKDTNSGLVFYPNVNGPFGTNEGYKFLQRSINAEIGMYSGGAPKSISNFVWNDIKTEFAKKFKDNVVSILACTSAFGMGIDKPNIRYTVHMNIPKSIESFYQEAGRAGRDSNISYCCVIVSNDFPNRNRNILDPGTSLLDISNIVKKIPWGENDDISRMMFFHIKSFKGIEYELNEIQRIIGKIENIESEHNLEFIWTNEEEKSRLEKGVHRLVLVGVIADYTIDYSKNTINFRLSGNSSEDNLNSYFNYLKNYDKKLANQSRKIAESKIDNMSHVDFVYFLVEHLVTNFIYKIIELSRRRALSEMLEASTSNPTDEGIRKRILNYLELGKFSELLESVRETSENLDQLIPELMIEIGSPTEASELRGQVSRILESYPTNPPLLLVRAFSEVFCKNRNDEIVIENLAAYLKYSISEDGWGMMIDEVIIPGAQLINEAKQIDIELSNNLVVVIMEEVKANRDMARFLVEHLDIEVSNFALNYLINDLNKNISIILN